MDLDQVLPLLPVNDYVLPGLFLLLVMGAAPLLLVYALLARPDWPWIERFFRWSRTTGRGQVLFCSSLCSLSGSWWRC